ncbi:hypothetical protein [Cellulomonas sp.]|uniref:hypothetical protein n=1 Tax=Cellulomonas sp. TaxID=40001 RepID=UPI00258503C4|nr:hypothetical protein [Cellulomonas sp.]MCR6689267.1 hypothetical protein [Cellulomonas sp.]
MRRALSAAAAAVGLVLGLASPSGAAAPSWSVRPQDTTVAVLAHAVPAGARVDDAVVVTNEGAEVLELTVATADTVPGDDGALQVADTRTGAGGWVDVPADPLVLAPGERAVVPVRIAVPAEAAVGEHVAAVVTTAAGREGGVAVERRLGLRVVLTVGPRSTGLDGGLVVGFLALGAAAAAAVVVARRRRGPVVHHVDGPAQEVR